MMKYPLFILLILIIVASCSPKKETGAATVHGHFAHSANEKVILGRLDVGKIVPLDSVSLDKDGRATFTFCIDQIGFFLLIFPDGQRITLIMKAGDDIDIKGDLRSLQGDLSISGSEDSQLYESFLRSTQNNIIRIDSMKRVLRKEEGSDNFLKSGMIADSLFSVISGNQKKLEQEFIEIHPSSLASLLVLNFSFGPVPVLNMETDLSWYVKLSGLWRKYPTNIHVLYHMKRISQYLNNLREEENMIQARNKK